MAVRSGANRYENVYRLAMCNNCEQETTIMKTEEPKKKLCNGCDTWKELEAFHINHAKKDGRESQCKDCRNKTKQINKSRMKAAETEFMDQKNDPAPVTHPVDAAPQSVSLPMVMPAHDFSMQYTLTLDFSEYPYLLENLKKDAFKQFRTTENHLLSILDGHLKMVDYLTA
jgi:hypothetical protein